MKIWLALFSVLVVACVPGALAAPFADGTALKAAVDSCLVVNATGVTCCATANCGAAGTDEMDKWDVSLVTDMGESWNTGLGFIGLFTGASAFNANLSSWDVSSVTKMGYMFYQASAFNADLSSWDVSSVTDMRNMFREASAFNADISGWDTSSVMIMYYMFAWTSAFNADLSSWDVSSVTHMDYMFTAASAFNADLSEWDTSSVTSMYFMFASASAFNADLSSWDVSSVTDMTAMFVRASSFDADITGWDTAALYHPTSSVDYMFNSATAWLSFYERSTGHARNAGPPSAWTRTGCYISSAPENGDVGICPTKIVSGSTCQPTCNSGYTVSGTRCRGHHRAVLGL